MLKKILLQLTLLTGSVLVALFISELIIRSFIPVRNVGPVFSTYSEIYGKRLKTSFSARRYTPEFEMTITTNRFGFRGPDPEYTPENAVLFLGDSFTMGYGVNDGEEFPELIRIALNQKYGEDVIPVINAGIGNNGNGRWVKFLEKEATRYNPQLVILQPLNNDFSDNISEDLYSLSDNGDLTENDVPPPSFMRKVQSFIDYKPLLEYSYLLALVKQTITHSRAQNNQPNAADNKVNQKENSQPNIQPNELLTLKLIERAIVLCKEKGWPVKVLIIDLEGARLRAVQDLLSRHGVQGITLPKKSEHPDHYYKYDGHWNAAGHRHAADQILKSIENDLSANNNITTN